jgi:hypothetical protein
LVGRPSAQGQRRPEQRHASRHSIGPRTIGYLVDTILTRDTWMHRIDIARAIGTPPALTHDHDGALVADVVTEWAGRHGKPYQLNLSGTAGGTFNFGTGGPTLYLDAIEFVRTLSGRELGTELLAVPVPF